MLNKVLFTIFAIIAIWKLFSLVGKLQKEGGILARDSSPKAPRRPGEPQSEPKAVEMVACQRCGAYIDPRERCSCLT